LANVKKIFSSETAWQNGAKLGIDGPWVCPFQNCVQQPHPSLKTYDSTVLVYRQTKTEIVGESIYESTNTPNMYLQCVWIFYYRSIMARWITGYMILDYQKVVNTRYNGNSLSWPREAIQTHISYTWGHELTIHEKVVCWTA
jgi:hypothetical protein